ncbi:serine phosphatase RsbU, regulator of sigma subunit [Bernardetia litoralis DSM 6794]|uniref:Serine phosphatase RsbU, regulator of sigma subunit n=1 Tax=Bernardetia litoralis (strain ATCC 23117 / DSM 6794 / NBRC 15988 / NCIMB 1366 / Fx l1 / Sio-4) TaxID=880071 RepID=I4AF92_BERLS|nr:SpoIIE family protein phosphatase [Bernardetia litoralis]AFM02627.1 serine phosphatase RsbU, regulator of sigma subunit [Bernardetia litoralis DSM 6794]
MKNIYTFLILLISYCFWLPSNLFGQQYLFRNFGLEHGLPQSEVPTSQAGIVDSRGQIWVGTNGGGVGLLEQEKYRVFGVKDGLNSNLISSIVEDSKGNIWILSQNKNISKYDGKTFTSFPELNGTMSLGGQLSIDRWQNVWVLAFGAGAGVNNVLYWKPQNEKKFREYKQADLGSLPRPANLAITHTSNFETYLSHKGKLYLFNGKKFKEIVYPKTQLIDSLSNNKNLFLAHQDNDKNQWIWIADPITKNGNLIFFDTKTRRYNKIEFPKNKIPSGAAPNVNWSVFVASDSRLYVVAHTINIVFVFDKNQNFLTTYSTKNGFTGIMAQSGTIFEDKYGIIWVGTRGKGIVQLPQEKFVNYTSKEGLQGEVIFSIGEDKKNRIWLGSSIGGITMYENNTLKTVVPALSGFNRISDFWYKNDTVYAATGTGILEIVKDSSTKIFTTKLVNQKFGFPQTEVFTKSITEIDGIVWTGTQGLGITGYDIKQDSVLYNFGQNKLGNTTVSDIKKDSKGNYWFATFAGLVKWDGKGTEKSNFKRFTNNDGLGDNLLFQLYIDRRDIIWIIAYSGGLNRFDGKNFQIYQTAQGLSSDIIYSILPVKNQFEQFWIGTQKGLNKTYFRNDGKLMRVEKYGKEEGFFGDESSGKALFEDSKGNIWAGHLNGVTKCDFSKNKKITPPKTFINEVNLSLTQTSWSDSLYMESFDSLSKWNNLPQNLELKADQNTVNFDFYAADFSNPKVVQHQWWLEGLNKDWLVPTKKTEAMYSNLSAKKYIFHVRSRIGEDGEWGEESTFEFQIHPYWHQTWTARIVGLFLVLGIIFGLIKWRTRSLVASKKRLANLVEERTLEVVKRNNEILDKNQELEAQQVQLADAYSNIQEKNKNITASITYAKRIQDAMLPSDERINSVLENCFVFFKPRDIVSGDFYWISEVENKIIIAAVDCTGHGVPGAFVSVIGNNLLSEIIESQRILSPAKILDTLNENVRRHLNQDQTNNRDGMDMSICVIDKTTKVLTFAGAKNPLLHIHDDKIEIIKGDRFPIGGFDKHGQKPFTEHTIIPKKDSVFYMYSDGFQDQFGGLEKRKYMSRRFHKLLKHISSLPIKQQQNELDQEFEDWKDSGNEHQIDDVLVIGFRI